MTKTYGIWDGGEGGYVETCLHASEADRALRDLKSEYVRLDLGADELSISEMCPAHLDEEQPKDDCEECAEDYEQDMADYEQEEG